MVDTCPHCHQELWSYQDKKYLELYGFCWSCDKKWWEDGHMTTEEFEERERKSLED